jgi:LysR family glycine cleavage system transcriptional activator
VRTVAVFNDAGMMLQAAEQSMGLALSREMLAADALLDGSLVRLSPVTITHAHAQPYHLCFPAALRDYGPLDSFRRWLADELAASQKALRAMDPRPRKVVARKAPARVAAPASGKRRC